MAGKAQIFLPWVPLAYFVTTRFSLFFLTLWTNIFKGFVLHFEAAIKKKKVSLELKIM